MKNTKAKQKLLIILKQHSLSISMVIGAVAAVMVSGFSSFAAECEKIPGGILRLHILAESDSPEDQNLKLQLRDYILDTFSDEFTGCDSLESVIETGRELLPQIESSARKYTSRLDISAEITEMYFPTRVYDGFTLPAGKYNALRISIGEGEGENWWCVMYPMLCLPAVSDKKAVDVISLPKTLTDSPKIKFAAFEFFARFFK
jgi:stage II sporulation protein R